MSSRESRAVRGSAHRRRRSKERDPPSMSDVTPLRIVLLGKSVSENSGVGNFLLGRAAFDSEAPPDVVERVGGRLKDRHVMVINSPQLLQTNISDHQITQTVRECVNLSDPGPHVIVLLLKHEQCSAEDQECVEKVLDSFSERVYQHTMVLTTQESNETNDILQKIIQKCFNRHFSLQRRSSPDDLLKMFEDIVQMNDGRHLDCVEDKATQYFSMKEQVSEGVKLNLVVCGSDRTLKSSISELILQQTDRRSDVKLHGRQISLVELPALFNTRLSEEEVMRQTLRCVSLCHPGVHGFLLIIPDAPLNNEDKAEMEEIQKIFSSRINKHMMILIMQNSEHQKAELNEETQSVIERFGGRHHFFGPKTQMSTLMENIEKMLEENRGEFFSTETFLEAQMKKLLKFDEMKKKIHSLETHLLPQGSAESEDEVRIVLLGKTGVGKSATGNTILGRNTFKAQASFESVTKESRRETSEINGRRVTVIDTPGLFDTELSNEEIQREISNCISMILPGPHVFLLLIPLGRFTKEEAKSVKIIQETFGEKSSMFTMVLFTRGDYLKDQTIEQCLGKPGSPLMKLIKACGNRFHVFNNNQTGDRTQVSDLLEKIDNMVTANGGSFYSCKMFREMEREKQEQQMKILMDRVREREELIDKLEEQIRRERETLTNEIDQIRQEKEKRKTEKEKLQIKYHTETERLMNRIESERKKREKYTEREEQYKNQIKEKEREIRDEMRQEREEWEKQKQEEKTRREEDEKRREKIQSKHEAEENKMMMMMEKVGQMNREREELMNKLEEEKERMKLMMEEERQNDDKERKRREELKREIREQEEHQREIRDEMRRERETFKHEIEEMKQEKEKIKTEKDQLKIEYETERDRLMNRIQNHDEERKKREEEFNEREERYKREMKEKEELIKKQEEEKERMKTRIEEERQNHDKERKRMEEELKREIREQEKHQREIRNEMRRERETFKHEIEEMRQEKENLQIKYESEVDRLMNRTENERKKREEEFKEREERYKTLMKEKEESEEKMREEMKREREEWEKQRLEEKTRREEEKQKRAEAEPDDQECLRIVLIGRTGNGKSATGNTILGRKEFQSQLSTDSVTTVCEKRVGEVDGQSVAVVDTPGLFDTTLSNDQVVEEIMKCVSMSLPGPHVFVIVLSLGRFTKEETDTVDLIKKIFGSKSAQFSIVLFTRGDELENESIEDYVREHRSAELKKMIRDCGNRFLVFNNREKQDKTQVIQLLNMIEELKNTNEGRYFTNSMFEEAEMSIKKRMEEILKEREREIQTQHEKLKAKYEMEKENMMKRLKEEKERADEERKTMENQLREKEEKLRKEFEEKEKTEQLKREIEKQKRSEEEKQKKNEYHQKIEEMKREIENQRLQYEKQQKERKEKDRKIEEKYRQDQEKMKKEQERIITELQMKQEEEIKKRESEEQRRNKEEEKERQRWKIKIKEAENDRKQIQEEIKRQQREWEDEKKRQMREREEEERRRKERHEEQLREKQEELEKIRKRFEREREEERQKIEEERQKQRREREEKETEYEEKIHEMKRHEQLEQERKEEWERRKREDDERREEERKRWKKMIEDLKQEQEEEIKRREDHEKRKEREEKE